MKTIINYFRTAPMTKKLTLVVTMIWAITAVGNVVFYAFTKISLNEAMDYIQNAFILTLSSYMVKSGAENIFGVKSTSDFIKKVIEVTTSETTTTNETKPM